MDKVWFPELGHKLAQDKAKRSRLATHTHTQGNRWKRFGRGQTVRPMVSKKEKETGQVTYHRRRAVLKNKAGGHETSGQENKIDKT